MRVIDEQVRALDQDILDHETLYLEQTRQSLLKGFDFYLSTRPITTSQSRSRVRVADRLFSFSSVANTALPEAGFVEPMTMWEKENAADR